ncbi:MAG: AAA family ATPase [Nanobdellota archaeon]
MNYYVQKVKTMIVFTHGPPTSGKSTITYEIEKALQQKNISCIKASSVEKRDKKSTKKFTLQSIDETNPFTKKQKDDSYKKLIENASKEHQQQSVILLDATFHKKYRREWLYEMAKEKQDRIICIDCKEPDSKTVNKILDKRKKESEDKKSLLNSIEQFNLMKEQQESLEDDEIKRVLVVNHTHDTTEKTINTILEEIR